MLIALLGSCFIEANFPHEVEEERKRECVCVSGQVWKERKMSSVLR